MSNSIVTKPFSHTWKPTVIQRLVFSMQVGLLKVNMLAKSLSGLMAVDFVFMAMSQLSLKPGR